MQIVLEKAFCNVDAIWDCLGEATLRETGVYSTLKDPRPYNYRCTYISEKYCPRWIVIMHAVRVCSCAPRFSRSPSTSAVAPRRAGLVRAHGAPSALGGSCASCGSCCRLGVFWAAPARKRREGTVRLPHRLLPPSA